MNKLTGLFLMLLVNIPLLLAQQVFPGGGSGSYRLDYPSTGPTYPQDIYAPIGQNATGNIRKTASYTGPFQTHQWWNTALWTSDNVRHSNPMYPYPLFLQAASNGYVLRYGTEDINGLSTEIECHSAVTDAIVGLSGQTATETDVDSYGDWHVVLYQDYGSGNKLRMTGAKGSPYAFFQRSGTLNPTINGLNKQIVTKSTSGNSFIFMVAPEGRNVYFAVFFPAGTLIAANNGTPTTAITALPLGNYGSGWDNMVFAPPAGDNYFSVAVMSDISQATLDLYEARAFNVITSTTHSYSFNPTTSKLTTTFQVGTTAVYGGANAGLGTLQALMKHQYTYSPEAAGAANTGVTYLCPRGTMKVLATNTFTTVMTHQGILPNLAWANDYSKTQMKAYIDNYLPTVVNPQIPADGYNKDAFVELGNIIQIASQIGYTSAKTTCLDALEQRLTNWFTSPTNEDWVIFVYGSSFNWLAHYPNGFTSSGEFIDMHFHMAYLIYGAAILARERPTWATQYGAMVETMIRQCNDYRKDATSPGNIGWFPYLRFFDPYEGHSWADPGATNQESVSEALTFASGTFLWGETVGNNNLRDLGALLYITETETAKMYWFDVDQNVNKNWGTANPSYPQNHITILRAAGGSYATFFSGDERWRYAIDLLPQTAGSLWQIWNPTYAQRIFNDFPAGGYPTWDNFGFHYDFVQSGYDAAGSVSAFNTYAVSQNWINATAPNANGNIPELYQWTHTMNVVGEYDNTVQADISGFSVFSKSGCKYYMVYMPPGRGPKVVNFNDGNSFNVPDDTVIVYQVCPLPVTWLSFTAQKTQAGQVQLNWATATEINNHFFDVEKSTDGQNWQSIGTVNGNGNTTSIHQYYFTDGAPQQGILYYRLKQTDDDGNFDYSNTLSVFFDALATESFTIYPNPTTGILTVSNYAESFTHCIFTLRDIYGRVCELKNNPSQSASAKVFDLNGLSNAIYLLEIKDSQTGWSSTIKVIKE
jgi:endoglucanase Acf2